MNDRWISKPFRDGRSFPNGWKGRQTSLSFNCMDAIVEMECFADCAVKSMVVIFMQLQDRGGPSRLEKANGFKGIVASS